MPQVNTKTAKKIGLFAAISMLIGSIVGVGIFFKNGNIFATNDYNAIGILVAWILSGIISLSAAFSFAEVGSSLNSNAGLGGWCYKLVGKRFGNFVKTIQPFFYFTVLAFSISIFSGEAIFNIFNVAEQLHFAVIMLVGLLLFIFFIGLNYFSLKASSRFQMVATTLKFVPILIVIITGIIYGVMNPQNSLFSLAGDKTSPIVIGDFNFGSVLIAIPSILFAFDPFFGVGNLSNDMKNPQRNVPLTIIISMIIVTIAYLLVTISQILVGTGNVYELFAEVFESNDTVSNAFRIVTSIFIFISIVGVLNSFCALMLRSYQSLIDENLIIGVNKIESWAAKLFPWRNLQYKGALLLCILSYLFLFIIIFILSVSSSSNGTDAFVDGISNFPVAIFFFVYATVILGGFINRFTNKVKVQRIKGFMFFSVVAVLGCYLVSLSQIFYIYTVAVFMDPTSVSLFKWGLFSSDGFQTEAWMGMVLLFAYLGLLFIYYFVNHYFLYRKKFSKQIPQPGGAV